MKTYLFSIISVCTLTILANQIRFIRAINITNTSNAGLSIKNNASNLSLILNATSLCIAPGSEEILDVLFELFGNDYKPVTLNDFTEPLLTCDGIFILETNNRTVQDCEGISGSYQTSVVYVTKDSITADFSRSLAACLSVTQSQEVLALSLSDGSLLQLSPVFPQPRHFVSTSVTDVLQRRGDKWKKLDLQGSPLNIGSLHYVPFFFHTKNKPPANEYDGIYLQLVKEMASQFNFTCRYLVYKGYGIALDNGTWIGGGLSQVIQEGKIDIVAVNMWQVPEFNNQVDFGPALNKAKMAFLVFRPELIDFQWQEILRIFKRKVWFSILLSFVLIVVVYWAGVNWSPRPCTESWSGCLLTIFGFFTSSSTHSVVDEGNTRFALTSWSVFSLLITTCLSTGIVTRLTVPSYSPRVDTVKQLVEGDYLWTVQFYADFINSTLLKETMFDLQNYWIQKFEERYVYLDEDEVARTAGQDKKMTFLSQIYGNDFVVMEAEGLDGHTALNKYRVSKESTTEAHVTFGVKKQSFLFEPLTDFSLLIVQVSGFDPAEFRHYTERVYNNSIGLARISVFELNFGGHVPGDLDYTACNPTAGLMTRWRDEVIRRWPQYDTRHLLIEQDVLTFREPQGLPLYKMQPVFILLLFGLSLASFVFFIEIYW